MALTAAERQKIYRDRQNEKNSSQVPEAIDIAARIIDRIYPILQKIILEELNYERKHGTNTASKLDA